MLRAPTAAELAAAAERRKRYRRGFADALEWERLARARGLRLPNWGTAVTTGEQERWLRRLGVSVRAYCEWAGERKLGEFAERNPDWPTRAWVGLLLEATDAGWLA